MARLPYPPASHTLFALPPYPGLFFAYGREISYTSIKLGAYAPVRDALGAGKDAPFYLKFLAGAITGGVGSFVGNPFDVLKTLQVRADSAPGWDERGGE